MKVVRLAISNVFIAFLFSLVWVISCLADETIGEVYIKAGEHLYNQNCVFCHQADAIGKPGMAPSLTNKELLSMASDEFFLTTIRDGRPGTGMPPFAHLEEGRIKAIIAFLRSHSQLPYKAVEIDSQPDAHGDPRLGKQWFGQICATCHGENGNGYAAGGTGTAIGMAGFLDKVSDGFIRTTIKEGRSNTRMLSFQGADGIANLSDQEIDDVIVYLRSLPKENK
jgi:cytochrome c oxidase cbb3-type subunit 3